MNLYGFGGGDPVNFSDPFGLCPPKDDNVQDCESVEYWRNRARNSSSIAGKVGNSVMAGLAAIGEDAKAEIQGEDVGGCGTKYVCGVVPDFGPGAKGAVKFAEHVAKYERASGRMEESNRTWRAPKDQRREPRFSSRWRNCLPT